MSSGTYSVGWADPRAIYGEVANENKRRYGGVYIDKRGLFCMGHKKVDAHEYVTEATILLPNGISLDAIMIPIAIDGAIRRADSQYRLASA